MARPSLYLSGNPSADRMLTRDPLALVIGMVLDQQIPLEWAFSGPYRLSERLGTKLSAKAIANMDPDALAQVFAQQPALHRYHRSMSERVQGACRLIADNYSNKAERIWTDAGTGQELLKRLKALPGFGEQKAKIFMALLAKQLDVKPQGWQAACDPFGEAGTFRSVADIVSADTLAQVRLFKQEMKAALRAQPQPGAKAPSGKPTPLTKKAPAKTTPTKKAAATAKKAPAKTTPTKKAAVTRTKSNKPAVGTTRGSR